MAGRKGRIIVGLGNPGTKYKPTKHNLGFMLVDKLAEGARWYQNKEKTLICDAELSGVPLLLVKPQTFMNLSGKAVAPIVNRSGCDPHDLVVIHDDLDIGAGRVRIKIGGGDGGHRGIRSIADSLRFRDFIRIRLGIGRPPDGIAAEDYVLMGFDQEQSDLPGKLIDQGCHALITILERGIDAAQNVFHSA